MVQISSRFAARWLTLACVARRNDAELSAAAALQRAQTRLERYGAGFSLHRDEGAIRFRSTWRTGRSWLIGIMRGSVRVTAGRDGVVVVAQASLVPLFAWMVVFFGFATATGITWLVAGLLLVAFGSNTLFVYRGLRSIAADAVRL
jgi:hypothetical protein